MRVTRTVKRSISLPADLDAAVEAAARLSGLSVSAWIATVLGAHVVDEHREHEHAHAEATAVMREWQDENGAFTPEELAEGRAWLERVLGQQGPGRTQRKSA